MTARRPKVVFLAHAADRTGPPMWLASLLRNLPADDLDLEIVLLKGGELEDELAAAGRVRVIGEPIDPRRASPDQLRAYPEVVRQRRADLADLADADLVVVCTAWSANALPWLPPADRPVVAVIHELQEGFTILEPDILETLLTADVFVAGCAAIADVLRQGHRVDPARIVMVPYGTELPGPIGPAGRPGGPDGGTTLSRATLAADDQDFLIVAAAVPVFRKAPDLFVHLAGRARSLRPDVAWQFRWLGADTRPPLVAEAERDADYFGVADCVRFLPSVTDLRSHLALADAFALVSREDAFPLVCLEAAAAGIPIAAFATGGIGELVRDDAGTIVPYPDLDQMASVLAHWHDEPHARVAAGTVGATRVATEHAIGAVARQFGELIRGYLPSPGLGPG